MEKRRIVGIVLACAAVIAAAGFLLRQQLGASRQAEQQTAAREEIASKDPDKYERMAQNLADARAKVKQNPADLPAWMDIGVISAAFGDAKGAEDAYRHIISLNVPGDLLARGNLAEFYKTQQRWPEAVQTYREALAKFPVEIDMYYNLAQLQAEGKGGTVQDALDTLNRGIEATGDARLKKAKDTLEKGGKLS